jgi:methylenetetrahydrofolate dehydrogenase (NADP+) / methenyltetrahydrofolate cyclohydrolase
MIVDGKTIATEILARAKVRAAKLPHQPQVVAIVGEKTAPTLSYLAIKQKYAVEAGCSFTVVPLGAPTAWADAVLVQLPLPANVDTKKELDAISLEHDVDVLSSAAREKFARGSSDALLPPVVAAIREIFKRANMSLRDKKGIVIGDGWLVGKPAATWLIQQGVQVEVLNLNSGDISARLGDADIIISGTGASHLIKPHMIKEGVALIDAGTSESSGVLTGDADPSCAPLCSIFTPVPGGVGPIAVACLFDNAVTLAERK